MFNTETIKKQAIDTIQSMNEREIIAANIYLSKLASKKNKKTNILDLAGAWNELPKSDIKELDNILANRRKSLRRSGI